VTAVGGTTLQRNGSGWTESVWSGTGSGCSAYIAKPSWQNDPHCPMRMVADVAAAATCGGDYLCTAAAGYDGPAGWGTPQGLTGLG
jgi:hypothetical protein